MKISLSVKIRFRLGWRDKQKMGVVCRPSGDMIPAGDPNDTYIHTHAHIMSRDGTMPIDDVAQEGQCHKSTEDVSRYSKSQ